MSFGIQGVGEDFGVVELRGCGGNSGSMVSAGRVGAARQSCCGSGGGGRLHGSFDCGRAPLREARPSLRM